MTGPTMAELLEAVREFLERDVMPATDGRVNFHARVARNVVAMVERELALGDRHRNARSERLSSLGFADEVELAAAIRAGELDDRWTEVHAAVLASAEDELAVSNPRWIEPQAPTIE